MHRSAQSTVRTLALGASCLLIPVALLATSCSSILGEPKDEASKSASSDSPSASPTVKAAKFAELPSACRAVPAAKVKELVAKAKPASGTAVKSPDTSSRGGCVWSGLDGYQFRYLDVTLQRLESDPALGTGEKRAEKAYARTLKTEESTKDVAGLVVNKLAGLGDEAVSVSYTQKKDKETLVHQTVMVRLANVVVMVRYEGSGFAGAKEPKAADIAKGARSATEAALAAVESAE
ncbi:DUF3558 domain-containing protein [Streptomyces polyrhachis]|uniref:DUF3558 domain-containing protein n=1 Tax=Streptomyces polyrhachis TaxID=1282885 RepID=A0ABW2GLF7_9ACTN